MNALCLREVNSPVGRSSQKKKAYEGIAEKGGDGGYGAVEDGVVIAH